MGDPLRQLQAEQAIMAAVHDLESMTNETRNNIVTHCITVVEAWLALAPNDMGLAEFKTTWSAIRKGILDAAMGGGRTMRNKLAYWRYEGWMQARKWWHRHWWPAHIRQLDRERADWKRWLTTAEQRLFECRSDRQLITDAYEHWQVQVESGDPKAEAAAHESFFGSLDAAVGEEEQ